jgi:hypothetical protein
MDFHTSIMVDTALSSLAQNLDGDDWPLPGKDETPAKYIDLSFEELRVCPGLNGHPEHIDQLIGILEETLAFDNPFGEMVAQSTAAAADDNPLLKTLTRLEIPTDFPIENTLLSADVKGFCKLEKITTLAEFANFAQNMPPQVVVGGDFRTLLNALAHVNEKTLAALLPFRVGGKGLHLPEALGQVIDSLTPAERLSLLKRNGLRLNEAEEKTAAGIDRAGLARLQESLGLRVAQVQDLFAAELRGLPAVIKEHGSLGRYLVVLGDSRKEALVAKLIEPMLPKAAGSVAVQPKSVKAGWWGVLTGWFRK